MMLRNPFCPELLRNFWTYFFQRTNVVRNPFMALLFFSKIGFKILNLKLTVKTVSMTYGFSKSIAHVFRSKYLKKKLTSLF